MLSRRKKHLSFCHFVILSFTTTHGGLLIGGSYFILYYNIYISKNI